MPLLVQRLNTVPNLGVYVVVAPKLRTT